MKNEQKNSKFCGKWPVTTIYEQEENTVHQK